jgi:hypothetical protein
MSQNKRDFYKCKLKKIFSNKRDKDDKYSEDYGVCFVGCKKIDEEIDSLFALREINAMYFKLLV